MTFRSEEVRLLFHQLPMGSQIEYSNMEHRFAKKGWLIHIEDVIYGREGDLILEVVLRISENYGFVPANS